VLQVQVMSHKGLHRLSREDLHYSYRSSVLQLQRWIAVQVVLQLQPGGNPEEVLSLTRQNLAHRKNTQPYHLPSCGSVFRNPNPYKAGWLIEQTGLKGYQIGNAQVSTRHANFIVNLGGATATDIYYLIHEVQEQIRERWSVDLEPEVKMLGEFPHLYLTERAAS
jgi:UDP-N-acetylmuramate dehydrogenase